MPAIIIITISVTTADAFFVSDDALLDVVATAFF
jgi:hypothetical protein